LDSERYSEGGWRWRDQHLLCQRKIRFYNKTKVSVPFYGCIDHEIIRGATGTLPKLRAFDEDNVELPSGWEEHVIISHIIVYQLQF
jgi:hypothetical protein